MSAIAKSSGLEANCSRVVIPPATNFSRCPLVRPATNERWSRSRHQRLQSLLQLQTVHASTGTGSDGSSKPLSTASCRVALTCRKYADTSESRIETLPSTPSFGDPVTTCMNSGATPCKFVKCSAYEHNCNTALTLAMRASFVSSGSNE